MKKASRGLALISVLILCVVLLVLLGAFLGIHRAGLSTLGDVSQESKSRQAALSGLDYAVARLTADEDFGKAESTTDESWTLKLNTPALKVWEMQAGGFRTVVGLFADSGFQMTYQQADSPVEKFASVVPASALDNPSLPNKWQTNGTDGRYVSKNLFDQPSDKVSVQPKVGFRPHPGRTSNIQVMGFTRESQVWLDATVLKPTMLQYALQAGAQLSVAQAAGSTWSLDSKDPYRNQVAGRTGVIVPDPLSSTHAMQFGPKGGEVVSERTITLADGVSVDNWKPLVTSGSAVSAVIGDGTDDAIERSQAKASTGGEFKDGQSVPSLSTGGGGPSLWGFGTDATDPVILESGEYVFLADNKIKKIVGRSETIYTDEMENLPIVNGQLRIPPGKDVTVSGDFHLTKSDTYSGVPYIALGDVSAKTGAKFEVSGEADLQATVVGIGTFQAQSGLTLEAKSQSSSVPDLGVGLVVKDGNLTFAPVDSNFTASGDRNAAFTGVAYSKGDLVMELDGHDLKVEGALVSESSVLVSKVSNLVSVYDPAQVDRVAGEIAFIPNGDEKAKIVYKSFR